MESCSRSVAGWVIDSDHVGVVRRRRIMGGGIGTGLANGLVTLFIARALLGLGESATFPTATKAMVIWLPARKRAFAQGITHSFSRLGNAITPHQNCSEIKQTARLFAGRVL